MTPEEKRAYDREYHSRRSPEKKAAKVATQRARRRDNAEFLARYKAGLGCPCGEMHPACLDFHHRDGGKEINPADAVSRAWSKSRLLAELGKCDVLCSNCHRKLHYAERVDLGSNPTALTTYQQRT